MAAWPNLGHARQKGQVNARIYAREFEGSRQDSILLNGPWEFARGDGNEGAEKSGHLLEEEANRLLDRAIEAVLMLERPPNLPIRMLVMCYAGTCPRRYKPAGSPSVITACAAFLFTRTVHSPAGLCHLR